jgi:hypothetical protein
MTDNLTDLLTMASDLDKLDLDGLEGFRKSFSKKITPPTDIYKIGEKAITKVFGIALTSLVVVIILILSVLLLCSIFAGWITVGTAILIILFVLFAFWLGYLLFNSTMENELDNIAMDVNNKIGIYSETFMEEILSAIKSGASSYAKIKKEKKKKDEEEIGPPLD